MMNASSTVILPYKSVAASLLFCAILGPVGLLYASFWGALVMIALTIVIASNQFFFLVLLIWITCCAWGVRSIENYNKKIYTSWKQTMHQTLELPSA